MVLKERGINTRNWVDSAQDRDYWRDLVNAALNLQVPYAMELVVRYGQTYKYIPLESTRCRCENNILNRGDELH
jgi:hypothetical protein